MTSRKTGANTEVESRSLAAHLDRFPARSIFRSDSLAHPRRVSLGAAEDLPVISADEALRLVLDNVAILGVERTPITSALARVLAEEIRSPRDIPGFDNSAMDGYAVRAQDVASASESKPARLRVIETDRRRRDGFAADSSRRVLADHDRRAASRRRRRDRARRAARAAARAIQKSKLSLRPAPAPSFARVARTFARARSR